MQNMQNFAHVEESLEMLRAKLTPGPEAYPVGLILGTGLGEVVGDFQKRVPFAELPHFPKSSADSHAGYFAATTLEGVSVLVQSGRCHLFEGFSPAEICMGVRVMHGMGVHTLVITNASGALNPTFEVGRLLLISDQVNLTGVSPLTGINYDAWGLRFPDMSQVFDAKLRTLAENTALRLGIALERGVYVGVHGPELETPAETRLYRALGCDAIGMSSVLEVICAKHLGMRILGLSCLSNKNLPDCMEAVAIEDIIASSRRAAGDLSRLFLAMLPTLAKKND